MPEDVSSPYLDTWKDWEPDVGLKHRHATTRAWVPSTGIADLTFRVSATEQGTAIGSLTGLAATEADVVNGEARYVGSVDVAVLTSQLPEGTYPDGAEVYLQVVKPGDVLVEAFKKIIRRKKY